MSKLTQRKPALMLRSGSRPYPGAMKIRAGLALLVSLLTAPLALAETPCNRAGEPACMLQAIWEAAAAFPEPRRDRLKPIFLDTVALSGDEALLSDWQQRLGGVAAPRAVYPDYAEARAQEALAAGGWDSFLARARAGEAPFNIGRPEIMAAGARLAPDGATRNRVVGAMFDLAAQTNAGKQDVDFERGDFGHVLAELSMESCDLAAFDRAAALTVEPKGLRYAFWRARITGDAAGLADRVRREGAGDDTRFVRAAMEGYGAILSRGYCGE
ncbi:MAG: hypothetical protein R3B98_02920 [Hyphomonas sp.]